MPRTGYEHTPQDLTEVIRSQQQDTRTICVLELHVGPCSGNVFIEVVVYARSGAGAGPELVRMRGPGPTKPSHNLNGLCIALVWRVYMELASNPWLWGPEQRAAARGEG